MSTDTDTAGTGTADAGARTLFRVCIEMDLGDSPRTEFVAAWEYMAAGAAADPANLAQSLSFAVDAPATAYIISDWTSQADFRRFNSGPHHDEHVAGIRALARNVGVLKMEQVATGPITTTEAQA